VLWRNKGLPIFVIHREAHFYEILMGQERKSKLQQQEKARGMRVIERVHPYKMLMYLGIFGSGTIFLFMLSAYTYSRPDLNAITEMRMPAAFVVSVLFMVFSGFTVTRALTYFLQEDFERYRRTLQITLGLGLAFMGTQALGWWQLVQQGRYLQGGPAEAYLYVVTGLHLMHVFAGLIYLLVLLQESGRFIKDPVKALVAYSNPYQKLKIELLSIFWRFVDYSWIALFLHFLFTFS